MEIGLHFLDCDNSSLWSSNLYKYYEDLREQYKSYKLSYRFSSDYCKNMKKVYGGKILVFKGLNAFEDVYGKFKLGIDHNAFIDSNSRVYDPFLGYYDIDVESYLGYIGASSKDIDGLLEYNII